MDTKVDDELTTSVSFSNVKEGDDDVSYPRQHVSLGDMKQLRKSRSASKGVLTRKRNELYDVIARQGSMSEILVVKDAFDQAVVTFMRAHNTYRATLIDEDDLQESEDYERAEQGRIFETRRAVNEYIKTLQGDDLEQHQSEDVRPEDSVSNVDPKDLRPYRRLSESSSVNSRPSHYSSASAKAKAAAKLAALEIEAAALRKKQELQKEELNLVHKKEELDLATALAKAQLDEELELQTRQDARAVAKSSVSLGGSSVAVRKILQDAKGRLRGQTSRLPSELEANKTTQPLQKKNICSTKKEVHDSEHGGHYTLYNLNPEAEDWQPQQNYNLSKYGNVVDEDYSKRSLASQLAQQNERMRIMLDEQRRQTLTLTLPQPEVPVFRGDPLDYTAFIRAFESLIECRTESHASRLYYLCQYTSGEVHELMRSCLLMEPEAGYQEARKLLKNRYGQSYKIASAHLNQLITGPPLRQEDGKGLHKLSIQLVTCTNTLQSVGYANKLENPETIRQITERLPLDLRRKWRVRADDITENRAREISISDLSDFVATQARIATQPIFGDIGGRERQAARQRFGERRQDGRKQGIATASKAEDEVNGIVKNCALGTSAASTLIDKGRLRCPLCHSDHWLSQCGAFKGYSLDQRLKLVREKGLCLNCLVPGHLAKTCPKRSFCRVEGCSNKHSTYLHRRPPASNTNEASVSSVSKEEDKMADGSNTASDETPRNAKVNANKELCSFNGAGTNKVGMAMVPVKVRAKQSEEFMVTYAFLDSGSNITFCSNDLLNRLGVKGTETILSLTTMAREKDPIKAAMVSLEICDLDENVLIDLPVVYSSEQLPVSTEDIPTQEDIDEWNHLKGVFLPHIQASIGLLIGSDVPQALQPLEVKRSKDGGPFASRTALGWVINGPLKLNKVATPYINSIKADVDLNRQFEQYCNWEFNDSISSCKKTMSLQDKQAMSVFKETAVMKDGHYEIAIPWITEPPKLPNNRVVAKNRLELLKKKLRRDPKLYERYRGFMSDLFIKGYARQVPNTSLARDDGKVWYLPHHSVINPQKLEKVRVVFDCAAVFHGTALNTNVLQGPDLTNSLVGVLSRFREETYALMADIEGMYHQVRVHEDDVDALRFLWFENGDIDGDVIDCNMMVHLFGGIWSPSCANFALLKTAEDNNKKFDRAAAEVISKNFYVDDCLTSVASEEEGCKLVKELTQLLSCGGFRLHKWISNSRKILDSISESERAVGVKSLDLDKGMLPIERALGVHWDVQDDSFKFKINIKDKPQTRRGILSTVSSVYDPLGFGAPVILQAKLILQELCRKGLSWDEEIPQEFKGKWQDWLCQLPQLESLAVPRPFKHQGFGEVINAELHHFSDASSFGYGAMSYLRLTNRVGKVAVSLIQAKSRLAPLKEMTIPRLELSAAVVAVKLDTFFQEELSIHVKRTMFWTDSTTVLKYIWNEDKRFHTFVANRLSVIHDASSPDQWKYVPSKLNPADDVSRGLSIESLLAKNEWLNGPQFLLQSECDWPSLPTEPFFISNDDPELKKEAGAVSAASVCSDGVLDLLIAKLSSWYKLKRCVAWVLKYISKLKRAVMLKIEGVDATFRKSDSEIITTEELHQAEVSIIKAVQTQSFPSVSVVRKDKCLSKLDPRRDESGLLRVGGRLGQANLSDDAKHQIILPKSHHLVDVIVSHYHKVYGHSGLEYVLALIREHYWIIRGRAAVKRILNKCVGCKRRQARPEVQKMADLPKDRVTPYKPPFSFVGVDCFGPFFVKRGRCTEKRYGVIFTCLAIRAIHIEIVSSLETDSFINSFRRFLARRGKVEEIRSDNGGNFVCGQRELRRAIEQWNQQAIHEFMIQKQIKWIFNPLAGSHHGGVWERCIRTVRKVLSALLKGQTLTDEGLATLMCEVEAIVNGRPITKLSDDPRDLQPLTPNQLLLMKPPGTLPPGIFEKEDCYSRRRWKQVQYLADIFWRRWLKEFLPLLQSRQKWHQGRRNLAVGDVVLVIDERTPRSTWPMGRITDVHVNKDDGFVRSVTVRTSMSVLQRSIDKLILLEAIDFENSE